ncbi:HNH endonuclease [candidate division KSB1 bacterium]|nr:HNH endonuclease [candidate division KSB1 bacterium]
MGHSAYLVSLDKQAREDLEKRLHSRQSGKCFICDRAIDLILQKGDLDVDHIDPLVEQGLDEENNFALTHASCNRSKGASDLRIARRMAEFEILQSAAQDKGERGANLGHLLTKHGGGKAKLIIQREAGKVKYSMSAIGDNKIYEVPSYMDKLSGMEYFFAVLPLAYLHHDDRINPRSIGSNIRGLIEEFMKKRPQLHVSLAWWAPDAEGAGEVKVFDGQHKAAAQILLGVEALPVRVFLEPDTNVLLQANTNAGGKLRQVAFDPAVMRHLGSSIFLERVQQYQQMKGLEKNDYSFSESDLVKFFKGEHREMQRYIVDSARAAVTKHKDNRLMDFVEWSGKTANQPLSYSAVERTFFSEFLYMKALTTPLDDGMERGDNPRYLEREQLVRLMTLFSDIFFAGKWDPDVGGRQLESRLQKGEMIKEEHLRAWRVAREEILGSIVEWIRLVIENYFAYTGKMVDKKRILHVKLPEELWDRLSAFLINLSKLPCWVDKNLSNTVFGAKQNFDFWRTIFKTGKSTSGVQVLAQPLDLNTLIVEYKN